MNPKLSFLCAAIISLAPLGCSGSETPSDDQQSPNPVAGDSDAIAAGARNYERQCAICHGDSLEGSNIAPPLVGVADRRGEQEMYDLISEGTASMAAYKDTLTDIEIWEIVAFLEEESGEEVAQP